MKQTGKLASAAVGMVPVWVIHLVSRNQWRYPRLRRLCEWAASLYKQRDGVIQHGLGRGLRFNVGDSHSGFLLGTHEPTVQELLATVLRPGMAYYDIGANVGFFAIIAARIVGPKGRVVCFEPLPSNAQQIAHNAQLNGFSQVLVRCEALGGSDRTERFLTSAEPTWGKLVTTGQVPDKHTGDISVAVRKLDNLCASGSASSPDLIKIDVEGAEIEVLAGALETLTRSRPMLIIELHGTNDAIAAALVNSNYHAIVLGSSDQISEAHWNSTVVAVPREREELLDLVATLSHRVAA